MTTVLPITPRTPSSLLAALALSPILGSLNSESGPSMSSFHLSAMCISTTHTPCSSGPGTPIVSRQSPSPPPIIVSPPKLSQFMKDAHRVIGLNEAHHLTLLIIQYFHPVRASSKGMMKASIELAEKLHESGIRWDRHRRVMGMHLRGIWEEGARLVGGIDRIGDLSLDEQGVIDLYVQGSFLSIAKEPHPLAQAPLLVSCTSTDAPVSVASPARDAADMPAVKAPITPPHVQSFRPSFTQRASLADVSAKDPIIWRKRMNHALKVHIDKKRMAAARATQPMSALSALSMMSVTELKWALIKRLRYRLGRAIGKVPRSARRMNFEMR